MTNDPKDPKPHTAADSLEEIIDAPLHAQVFGWIAGNIVLGNLTFADDVT